MEERTDLRLPAGPAAAKLARDALRHYGVNIEAEVVVTELVANAVAHGAPPLMLRIVRTGDRVRVEVRDQRPDVGAPAHDSRGLRLVEAFSTHWGVTHHNGNGKTVWAELRA
jgi:anti-sigma regulatory factor (Ser/Thr protein kinase)